MFNLLSFNATLTGFKYQLIWHIWIKPVLLGLYSAHLLTYISISLTYKEKNVK